MKVRVWGCAPNADELCTFKVNALIECLTAVILLENIDLILVGRAFIYLTHCALYKMNIWNIWCIPNNPSPLYGYSALCSVLLFLTKYVIDPALME